MNIGLPELIYIGLMIFNLIYEGFKNGQPKTGTHSLGITFIASIISIGIVYWGGFFK